jgi:hypothetical protein
MLISVDLCDRDYQDLLDLAKQSGCQSRHELSQFAGWILCMAIFDRLSGQQDKFERMDETIEHIKYLMVQPVKGTA